MKRFLKLVLIIAAILFAINGVLDIYTSHLLKNCKDRRFVGWSDITRKQINADMVIMGPSRAWVFFSPAILDSILHLNSYNMGIDGSCLNRQIIKYNIYEHYQQTKPKYIIINIDYFILDWTIGYEREQFFPYMLDKYPREQILLVEPFTTAELYIPVYRYLTYKGLFALWKEAVISDDGLYKGYKGLEMVWDGEEFEKRESFHFTVDERTYKMFDEFLSARIANGQKIIFCYAPIYIGLTHKMDNLQEAYATFQTIADKYDIPILDYNYSPLSYDTTYFYNASHLTKQGSELFSIQLAHDLDSLNISGQTLCSAH